MGGLLGGGGGKGYVAPLPPLKLLGGAGPPGPSFFLRLWLMLILSLQVMFETFNIPALHVGIEAVLAAYASGCCPVIVLHVGDSVTHVVPVWLYGNIRLLTVDNLRHQHVILKIKARLRFLSCPGTCTSSDDLCAYVISLPFWSSQVRCPALPVS